jgi:hypothetical protein
MSDAGTSAASKEKLDRMLEGFGEFEGIMKDATRVCADAGGHKPPSSCRVWRFNGLRVFCHPQQRRDLDQFKLEELKREMGVLEKEFESEVRKRTEMGSSLHTVRTDLNRIYFALHSGTFAILCYVIFAVGRVAAC